MIYDKVRTDRQFNKISSDFLTPSSALCYLGYLNDVSGKVTLKINDGNNIQSICNDATVVPVNITTATNLNYKLGDIFYADNITSGEYTITVSNLGGAELRGRSILLYLNNVPADTIFTFGNDIIIYNTDTSSYCVTFSNLRGDKNITCLSVWKTPGVTA